jgi:pimeloyl-ACP methyl ester carboxylesterase
MPMPFHLPGAWLLATLATAAEPRPASPHAPPDTAVDATGCGSSERYSVPTADGAVVGLHRHPADGPPVLLVHGISSNHHFMDLKPDRSLAVALQQAGYDTWLLDLRGHGDATTDTLGVSQRSGWTMDDYGRYDLPAAVGFVLGTTGFDQLGYVGHSMGGMVLAIYTAIEGDDRIAGAVVLGSPVEVSDPETLMRVGRLGIGLGSVTPRVPSPAAARLAARVPRLPLRLDDLLYARGSIDSLTRKQMYREVVSPLSRHELRQLGQIIGGERFRSADGAVDYTAALGGFEAPILVVAGAADRVAPAARVLAWQDLVGSTDIETILLSTEHGYGADYGHLDSLVGDRSAAEVYPRIANWFAGRWDPAPSLAGANGPGDR